MLKNEKSNSLIEKKMFWHPIFFLKLPLFERTVLYGEDRVNGGFPDDSRLISQKKFMGYLCFQTDFPEINYRLLKIFY